MAGKRQSGGSRLKFCNQGKPSNGEPASWHMGGTPSLLPATITLCHGHRAPRHSQYPPSPFLPHFPSSALFSWLL